jgi:drug/metabolite transporter (DMT)-like permease
VGLAFLLAATIGWGVSWPVQKFLLTELPPLSMRAATAVIAMPLAFALATVRGERLAVPANQWPALVLMAMLNYGLFLILAVTALAWLRASEAAIYVYSMPTWAALIAWLGFGERPTRTRVVALVLGIAGVVVLVGGSGVAASWDKLPGIAAALGAAWSFAFGTVLSKHRPLRLPLVAGVAWQVTLGALPPVALALFERPNWQAVTPLGWIGLFYAAVVPLVLAYLAWFRALRLLPASTVAIGSLLAPVIGVTGSALLLGEPLGARQIIALVLTLAGIALAARG